MGRFSTVRLLIPALALAGILAGSPAWCQEVKRIDNSACASCHETSAQKTKIADDISHSIHAGLGCLDCHADKNTVPHQAAATKFFAGCEGCRRCHEQQAAEYRQHGRSKVGSCDDLPRCSTCHGGHDVLPSRLQLFKTHPSRLPATCGACHENLDITAKYDILVATPVRIYNSSVHGRATRGGVFVAATCSDCHSTGGSAHKILGPDDRTSTINHFNIPATCGKCHKGVEADYRDGIHGRRAAQGETDVPVCTIVLWFDNWFIQFFPKGALDVALVVHYWEAWLATLAIAIWHLYSVVFNPHVYPMNPSWITGMMPEDMYHHEHPGHLDEAKRETAEMIRKQVERVAPSGTWRNE